MSGFRVFLDALPDLLICWLCVGGIVWMLFSIRLITRLRREVWHDVSAAAALKWHKPLKLGDFNDCFERIAAKERALYGAILFSVIEKYSRAGHRIDGANFNDVLRSTEALFMEQVKEISQRRESSGHAN